MIGAGRGHRRRRSPRQGLWFEDVDRVEDLLAVGAPEHVEGAIGADGCRVGPGHRHGEVYEVTLIMFNKIQTIQIFTKRLVRGCENVLASLA